jgi:hypothetical protein
VLRRRLAMEQKAAAPNAMVTRRCVFKFISAY